MKLLINIFIGLAFALVLFASCEELYEPAIKVVPGSLVIESHLTNDPQLNYVRISESRDFYSTAAIEWITGAHVELIEAKGAIIQALEIAPGNYSFQETPIEGNKYMLRISYQNDVFESEYVVMPPVPTIDSLYTENKIAKRYRTNGYGVPELFETPVRQIYIDAPITSNQKNYRFEYRAISQWKLTPAIPYDSTLDYTPEDTLKRATIEASVIDASKPDTSIHIMYVWGSIKNTHSYNLASVKEFSVSAEIEKHPILSVAYDNKLYLDSTVDVPSKWIIIPNSGGQKMEVPYQKTPYNWIIIIDQYGIDKGSYDFHEKLNQQFAAEGNLFDPTENQVIGNFHCVNDPTKVVLGFFDLNSHKQYRYYFNPGSGNDNTVVLRPLPLNRYFDIPDNGYKNDKPPVFWETNYN